ncbi:MAG: OmpA family protein [Treponema sp.]|nr:OmpA family protein [Treponema sp.]
MKKVTIRSLACVSLLVCAGAMSAFADDIYISPNNDGVKDELIIPLKITDKRYVKTWNLIIEDTQGNVVRNISNKIELPKEKNVKNFLKLLLTPKQGIAVPESVTWNGVMDNGETAPDGEYYFYVTATDDNNNFSKTSRRRVIVDSTPPQIAVEPLSGPNRIFGEGDKVTLPIKQNGSKEDEWVAEIRDIDGKPVRTMRWVVSEPLSFEWNGTNDNGLPVEDGVYSYSITATDRAGNVSAPAGINGIIFSAEKPAINVTLDSGKYFSPGTDSPLQDVTLGVTIPVPSKASGNKLVDWEVAIVDKSDKVVASYVPSSSKDKENPPSKLVFDGKSNTGRLLPNGEYQARVTAKYLNGYEPTPVKSPVFVLDTTKPDAAVRIADKIFSPDGDGTKDTIVINEVVTPKVGAPVKDWKGYIVAANDPAKVVKSFDFGEYPPESFEWDGIDQTGRLAEDGSYKYVVEATDLAGNSFRKESDTAFTLDTSKTEVLLTLKDNAFSPNNDKVKDTLTFNVVSKTKSALSSYDFVIRDAQGNAIKTITGTKNLPSTFTWDGKGDNGIICPDGSYTADLTIASESGSVAKTSVQPFVLDTQAPVLSATVPWTVFSPDGDSVQDVIQVNTINCSTETLWTAKIVNGKGEVVKQYSWSGTVPSSFEWNGTDESGNMVADGVYTMVFNCEDEAGNKFASRIESLTLDTREAKAFVAAELDGISPNGDGYKDTQKFTVRNSLADGIASWRFDITNEAGEVVRSWSDKDSPAVPAEIIWDGLNQAGTQTVEGVVTGTLTLKYTRGTEIIASSTPFVCSVIPPQLAVATAPEYFSPDNDGTDDDLFIKLSGQTTSSLKNWQFVISDPQGNSAFWQTAGTSTITERIIWDGLSNTKKDSRGRAERVQSAMDYPYTFTATDDLGMTSTVNGVINIDVLVIRDGDLLKMAVPSIIFRSDNADFKVESAPGKRDGVSAQQAANNERILNRIAQILNKFKDYKVTVVGHANRTTDNEQEEVQDNPRMWGPALIPLSQRRAEFVKDYLVKKGVNGNRLATQGKGGTELVADWQDKENNWKNRRVEFILNK